MSANIKNENTEHVDLTSILKDVENCIRSGLSNKLDTFFYEYDKYKKTHEEVLNLSIVRELLKRGSSVTSNVSEGTKPKLDPELEMIVLRNQVIFLRGEVNKYKNQAEALVLAQAPEQAPDHELESSQLNLEIKEKETEPLDIKSEDEDEDGDGDISDNYGEEDGDGDVSETSSNGDGSDDDTGIANVNTNTKYLPHIVEDNIQNIVLNVTEKNAEVVAEEEEAEEEVVADEEEAEEEEEDEEEVVADDDDEEEEDMPVKMPTFPTKTKPEPEVEVKPVIVEDEEEEEGEDDVETETEEDSDEEEEAEAAPATAPELKTPAPAPEDADAEEEEEEEELYEVEINGVMYVTNDDEDGTIYSYVNEEVGDKAGEFKGTVAHIYNGKNKGIYDRTLCKMDF